MNGWIWILVIAGGLVLAFVTIFVVIPLMLELLVKSAEAGRRIRYARAARKRNAEAKALRLARTDYEGWPLPIGKRGEITITRTQLVSLPMFRETEVMRIYQDRARDMGVELEMMREQSFSDVVLRIRWWPTKKLPRERY